MVAFFNLISINKNTEFILSLVRANMMLTMDQDLIINMHTAMGLWEWRKVMSWDRITCKSLRQASSAVDPSHRKQESTHSTEGRQVEPVGLLKTVLSRLPAILPAINGDQTVRHPKTNNNSNYNNKSVSILQAKTMDLVGKRSGKRSLWTKLQVV